MSDCTKIVENKVLSALNEFSMLQNTKNVVVGFSGGADSLCLLHTLIRLSDVLNIKVKAIHINHGIRGEEAKRDEFFAEDFCKKLGVPCKIYSFDCIAEAKKSGETLEECGRRIRYTAFSKEASDSLTKIATAHNANDNAETIIFNLSRGTSYKGGCGIPPVRDNIIRPLIYCTRKEIEGYCDENGLPYVTDSTNLCDDYTRNKIRHKILPVTEEINSSSIENFTSFSNSAREVADFISIEANKALERAFIRNNIYDTAYLKGLHNALLNEAIAVAFSRFSQKNISRDKIAVIKNIVFSGGRVQLYGNERVEVVKNQLRFFIDSDNKNTDITAVDTLKENTFGIYTVKFTEFTDCSNIFDKNILDNLIDCDTIVGTLFLRTRKEGDKFTLFKRRLTKSLKNLFNEYNIPVEQRKQLPVLCDDNGIVWIYGIGVCARCHITDKTKKIMLIEGEINA